jgi:hypothetical protein
MIISVGKLLVRYAVFISIGSNFLNLRVLCAEVIILYPLVLRDVQYLCVRFGLVVRSNGRDGVQTDTEASESVKH